ncbi:MAG: hypothetical protein WAN46_15025 [Gammaproteobacteria bacterium]
MPTHYPIRADTLYFNVDCYCLTKKPKADVDFYYNRYYNGDAYAALKTKYDPTGQAPPCSRRQLWVARK